jgi:acyl-CoA thioester hydrolase
VDASRSIGPFGDIGLGQGWVARSHFIEYLRPAYARDEIIVETHVSEMKKVTSTRVYRVVRRSDGEPLAKAETQWAFIDYATGKPTRIPQEIVQAYAILQASQ